MEIDKQPPWIKTKNKASMVCKSSAKSNCNSAELLDLKQKCWRHRGRVCLAKARQDSHICDGHNLCLSLKHIGKNLGYIVNQICHPNGRHIKARPQIILAAFGPLRASILFLSVGNKSLTEGKPKMLYCKFLVSTSWLWVGVFVVDWWRQGVISQSNEVMKACGVRWRIASQSTWYLCTFILTFKLCHKNWNVPGQ